jgi:flagellar biosynthesis protein FlhF
MHIKRFEARDMKQALARIRKELGEDALILESRNIPERRGWVEVMAAAPHAARFVGDAEALAASAAGAANAGAGDPAREARPGEAAASARGGSEQALLAVLDRIRRSVADGRTAEAPGNELEDAAGPGDEAGARAGLREQMAYLNRLVCSDHFSVLPRPWRDLYLDLVDAEVDSTLAFGLLTRLGSAGDAGRFRPHPEAQVLAYLTRLIQVGGAVTGKGSRRVLALVGPTGVGKTTTVAKIAGQAAFRLGLRVALVSTDSYRIGGAQQLGSYAALMGLPFDTVSSSSEMRRLLEGPLADSDLVLVDTSGRSPRYPRGIAEVHQLLGADPTLEIHLVLSATSGVGDLGTALESFSRLPIRHLIFTKLDETTRRGGVFTLAVKSRRPVSYVGTGQEVPDDLEPANVARLTEGLLEEAPGAERPDA